MGSTSGTKPSSRFPIVKQPDLVGLKECVNLMGPIERSSFEEAYGNLLWLLKLEVQTDAIVALSQHYDPKARCFFFRDCQLSPTLEEYSQILGFPQLSAIPYQYQGSYYSEKLFAALLQVSLTDLKAQTTVRNEVTVFPQKFLESRLTFLAQAKKWGLFKQLLALTIFGVILFPQMDGYVSSTAVGIFLAFRDEKNPINPIPAILADTYCTFTHHSELKGKRLSCSLHVLYAWFLVHAFSNKAGFAKLIEYAVGCPVPKMNTREWLQVLSGLSGRNIHWFIPVCWEDRPRVLFQCGVFQNVPLMGTKGCINYNPSLTLRQLGYPMRNAPTAEMLFSFYLHEKTPKDENLLRLILQSWERMVYKGKAEFAKGMGNEEMTFDQWLYQKIQKVYPSQRMLQIEVSEPKPIDEKLEDCQFALSQVEEEKKALQEELERMALKNKKLEDEIVLKTAAIEESNKRCKNEEQEKLEALGYLRCAREDVKKCNVKKREALQEASRWRGLCETARDSERHAQTLLEESLKVIDVWAKQCHDLERERDAIEELLKGNQQALRFEREMTDDLKCHLKSCEEAYRRVSDESKYWRDCYLALIDRIEEQGIIIELRDEIQLWRNKFQKLAELTNQAVVNVPKNLKKAEAEMHFLNTPPEVYKFVQFCRDSINELKEKAQEAAASKKRKRDENVKALCL